MTVTNLATIPNKAESKTRMLILQSMVCIICICMVQSGKYSTLHIAYPLVQKPHEFLRTKPSFYPNDHGGLGGKWHAYPSCS